MRKLKEQFRNKIKVRMKSRFIEESGREPSSSEEINLETDALVLANMALEQIEDLQDQIDEIKKLRR